MKIEIVKHDYADKKREKLQKSRKQIAKDAMNKERQAQDLCYY